MSSADEEIIITILVIVLILILAFSFYSLYTCTGGTFKQDDWDKDKCFIIPKKSTSPAPAPATGPAQDPATEPKQSPDSSIIKSVYEEALEYFNNFKPEDNLQFLTGLADEEWSEIQKKSEDNETKCTVKDASVLFSEGGYTEDELKETSDAIKNLCETQLEGDHEYCDNFTLNEISGDDVVNNIPNSGKFKTDYKSEKICYTHEPGKCFPRVYNPGGSDGTYSYDSEDAKLLANVDGETKYIDTNEICKTLLKKSDCDEKKIDYIYGSDKKICRWVTGIGAYVDPLEVYRSASKPCDEGFAYSRQVGTCELNTGLETDNIVPDKNKNDGGFTSNYTEYTEAVCPGQKLNPNYKEGTGEPIFIYDYVTRGACDSFNLNSSGELTEISNSTFRPCFFKPKQGSYELKEGKRLERMGEYDLAQTIGQECNENSSEACRQRQSDFINCGKCDTKISTTNGIESMYNSERTLIKDGNKYMVYTLGSGTDDEVQFAVRKIIYDELPNEMQNKLTHVPDFTDDTAKIALGINTLPNTISQTNITYSITNQSVTANWTGTSVGANESSTVTKSDVINELNKYKSSNFEIFITNDTKEIGDWDMYIGNSNENIDNNSTGQKMYYNYLYKVAIDDYFYKRANIYLGSYTGPPPSPTVPTSLRINVDIGTSDDEKHIRFYKNGTFKHKLKINDLWNYASSNNIKNCSEYHDQRDNCIKSNYYLYKDGVESRCQWRPNVHCYGEWNSPDTVIDGEGKEVSNTCGALVPGLKEERFNELSAQKSVYGGQGKWVNETLAVQGSKCKPEDIGWLDFTDYSESPSGSIATDANKEDRKLPQNYTHGVPYGWWKNARPKHGDVRYTACNVDCEEEISLKNCEDHSKDNPTEEDRMKLYSGIDDDLDNYDFEKAYYASKKECKGNETKYTVIKKYAQGKGGKKCDNFTFAESHGNFDDFANDYVKHIKGDTCVVPKMMCAAGSSCIVNTTNLEKLVDRINNGENIAKINNGTASDDDNSLEIEIDGTRYNKQNKITKEILFRLAKKECDRFGDMYGYPNKSFCTEDKIIYISEKPGVPPCEYEPGKCYVDEYTTTYTSSAGIKVFFLDKKKIIDKYKWFEGTKFIKPYEFCKWIDMPDLPE